jgi:hypothetical protein
VCGWADFVYDYDCGEMSGFWKGIIVMMCGCLDLGCGVGLPHRNLHACMSKEQAGVLRASPETKTCMRVLEMKWGNVYVLSC